MSSSASRSGGTRQGHDVEPVEEVLAERALAHRLPEVHVGRGDDPDVHGDGAGAAEALDLALLQRAQELGLEVDAQAAHLVEEQRAAVGQLELAGLARVGAGEGALLVAEQLRLEQGVGDRRPGSRRRTAGRGAGSAGGWRARPAPCRCRSPPVMSTVACVWATCAISS